MFVIHLCGSGPFVLCPGVPGTKHNQVEQWTRVIRDALMHLRIEESAAGGDNEEQQVGMEKSDMDGISIYQVLFHRLSWCCILYGA